MPDKVTNELLYEVLKDMQKRHDKHDRNFQDVQDTLMRVREDINNLRGDFLRLERWHAELETRVDRIETRLDLSDVTQ